MELYILVSYSFSLYVFKNHQLSISSSVITCSLPLPSAWNLLDPKAGFLSFSLINFTWIKISSTPTQLRDLRSYRITLLYRPVYFNVYLSPCIQLRNLVISLVHFRIRTESCKHWLSSNMNLILLVFDEAKDWKGKKRRDLSTWMSRNMARKKSPESLDKNVVRYTSPRERLWGRVFRNVAIQLPKRDHRGQ